MSDPAPETSEPAPEEVPARPHHEAHPPHERSWWVAPMGFVAGLVAFFGLLGLYAPTLSPTKLDAIAASTGAELLAAAEADPERGPPTPDAVAAEAGRRAAVQRDRIRRGAAVAALVAIFWITEALPIPVTSLLPLVLIPLLSLARFKDLAPHYGNANILLFLGGFMIAIAVERWNLHRRIALHVIRIVGDSPRRLVLGIMVATAFLSMWISNTATSIMMLTIGLALVAHFRDRAPDEESHASFSLAVMLAIAYSASIGGIGTLIGTPPNISFARIFEISFPQGPDIGFAQWMLLGVPVVLVMLPLTWALITFVLVPLRGKFTGGGRAVIAEELRALGPMSREERICLVVFVATALLWVFRTDIVFGTGEEAFRIPGWAPALGVGAYVHDGLVAILMAAVLFAIPSDLRAGKFLLDWNTVAHKVPWGILLLFGGGFALADAIRGSGLSEHIALQARGLEGTHPFVLIASLAGGLTFLTEVTSNTATTEVTLPVVASVAQAISVHPLLLMLPVTLACSCAFMLPVATPPNAIVFASGHVSVGQMMRVGFVLNIVGILVVSILVYVLAPVVFGFDIAGPPPPWALPGASGPH